MARALLFLSMCACWVAAAEGKPAAPEGKGGSLVDRGSAERPSLRGRLSLAIDWGASFATQTVLRGPQGAPLYLGGTASFWVADWFLLDAHGSHAFNNQRTAVLIGPRFRTLTWPVSASVGLRSGLIYEPQVGPRFGLSPIAGIDMILGRHFVGGLTGCVDVPLAGSGVSVRVGLTVGWRF